MLSRLSPLRAVQSEEETAGSCLIHVHTSMLPCTAHVAAHALLSTVLCIG